MNYAKFSAHCFSDLIDGFSTANQNLTTLDHYWASGSDTLYNTTQVSYTRLGGNERIGLATGSYTMSGQRVDEYMEIFGSDKTQ